MVFNPVVAAAIAVLLLSLYLYKLNKAMTSTPEDVHAWRPRAWTDEEIRETYERVCNEPIDFAKHLPPKLERRYIVVGGSGLVGGDIVLHLLARGQPPSSIRIVDFSKPSRSDMLNGPATKVDYVKTDITDPTSVEAAFSKPWPSDVANLPLTVFHTAAIIRPGERSMLFWDRTRRVNVDGTENVCDERDFDRPLRPHGDYFANYAYSKAIAERTVCGANAPGFRTGVIRPGMGIYGLPTDVICGPALREQKVVTFIAHVVQNFVSGWNVSLAHLLFEAALAGPAVPGCAGRPLVVTDAGPPPQWNDFFRAAGLVAATPLDVTVVSPLVMYLLAHVVEGWAILLARVPFLTRLGLSEPQGPIQSLQPAIWTPGAFVMVDDGAARRSVEEGGLGYKGVCTTLEGMCEQIRDWNRSQGDEGVNGSAHKVDKKSILEADLVEAHIVA
ncbi:Short-chain dehydrogenase/reductase family 42E member 1 [Cytospora mali]|uniref:Short-chain dehydrogenase/reductase family 42E member 1 n=1 Tax=Cytospora mali TaxID=578113 RepID=A0A194VH39_CYTMA|nr:Short-chain dehydrogenase/reductase family 42E member 1 [Valsa mali var. pyri (nom. inval.)]